MQGQGRRECRPCKWFMQKRQGEPDGMTWLAPGLCLALVGSVPRCQPCHHWSRPCSGFLNLRRCRSTARQQLCPRTTQLSPISPLHVRPHHTLLKGSPEGVLVGAVPRHCPFPVPRSVAFLPFSPVCPKGISVKNQLACPTTSTSHLEV